MTAILKFYKDLERYGLFKDSQFILNIPIELLNELVDKHQRNLSEKLTSSQTEISDEEIEKGAKEWYEKEGPYKPSAIAIKTWGYAIQWYREQFKKK